MISTELIMKARKELRGRHSTASATPPKASFCDRLLTPGGQTDKRFVPYVQMDSISESDIFSKVISCPMHPSLILISRVQVSKWNP